jgi:tetratricopeptide (TPR) repeat protein
MWFLKKKSKRKDSVPDLVTSSYSSEDSEDSNCSEKPFFVMDWAANMKPEELRKVQDVLGKKSKKIDFPKTLRKETFIRQESLRQSLQDVITPSKKHLWELTDDDALAKAKSLNQRGLQSAQEGEYLQAIGVWSQSLQLLIPIHGEFHPDVALIMNNMGIAYGKINLYCEAKDMLEESLFIRKELYGEEHVDVAATLHNIGNLLLSNDHTEEALEAFLETINIRTQIHGPHHEKVAFSHNGIGHAYYKMGNYDEAYDQFSESLRISTIAGLPMNHPVVEDSLSGINVLEEKL